ncbi:MAG: NUDIX hydrolase [Clostridia bacterium]|nr:NUDIX hydrolase [Clostridia bacterium]
MNDKLTEKTLSTENILDGLIFKVIRKHVELPDGKKSIREIVVNPDASAIVPIDQDNNIIMVKQYRSSAEKVMLEIPAGKMEVKETAAECAQRELEEETGYKADKIQFLFSPMVSPGFSTERIHIFLATGLTFGQLNPDDDEFVETVSIHISEVIRLIMSGEICDGKTISAVLAAARIMKV